MAHYGKNATLQRNADDKERLRIRMEKQLQQRRHNRSEIVADVVATTVPPPSRILPTQPNPAPAQQPPPPTPL